MKICKKCGGSLYGKEFNTYCEHEFDEPPESRCTPRRATATGPPS
jgi:hypothetical protein